MFILKYQDQFEDFPEVREFDDEQEMLNFMTERIQRIVDYEIYQGEKITHQYEIKVVSLPRYWVRKEEKPDQPTG